MGRGAKRQKVDNSLIDDELMSQSHELNQLTNNQYDPQQTSGSIPKFANDMTFASGSGVKMEQGQEEAARLVHETMAAQAAAAAQHAAQAAAAAVQQQHQHHQQHYYQQPQQQSFDYQQQQIPGQSQFHLQPPVQQQQQQQPHQPQNQQAYHLPPPPGYQGQAQQSGVDVDQSNDVLVTPMIEEQVFDNVDVLKEFVKEFGKKNEFGIAIAHSNNKAIYFTCELGGAYREKRNRKGQAISHAENTVQNEDGTATSFPENNETTTNAAGKKVNSKKIKCPFAMVANFSKKKNYWTLKITENKHNHAKLDPLTNFPMLRKRSNQVNITIKNLYTAGNKPSAILIELQTRFPGVVIKREDIYNEIRILKKKGLVSTTAELKNRKVAEEDMVPQHIQHHQGHGQQYNAQTHDPLAWESQGYQAIDPENKKEVEQQAAAAVAAVQALKEAAVAQGQQPTQQGQPQQQQDFSHPQLQQHYTQYQSPQQQSQPDSTPQQGQYQTPQQHHYQQSAQEKDDHFNIDERLLHGN